MAKFRKRAAEIEAYQVTKDLLKDVLFNDKKYPEGLMGGSASYNAKFNEINNWHGYVTTIHGQKTKVVEGDWIITEPNGVNHYPCKPDIFAETYEPAE